MIDMRGAFNKLTGDRTTIILCVSALEPVIRGRVIAAHNDHLEFDEFGDGAGSVTIIPYHSVKWWRKG